MKDLTLAITILKEIKNRLENGKTDEDRDFTYSAEFPEHVQEVKQILEQVSEVNAPKAFALFSEVRDLLLEIPEYTFESLNDVSEALDELLSIEADKTNENLDNLLLSIEEEKTNKDIIAQPTTKETKTIESYLASEKKEEFYIIELSPEFGKDDFDKIVLVSAQNPCNGEYISLYEYINKNFDNVKAPVGCQYRLFKVSLKSFNLVDRLKELAKAELFGWGNLKLITF